MTTSTERIDDVDALADAHAANAEAQMGESTVEANAVVSALLAIHHDLRIQGSYLRKISEALDAIQESEHWQ